MPVKVLGQETEFHRFKLQPVAGKRSGTLQDLRTEGLLPEHCVYKGYSWKDAVAAREDAGCQGAEEGKQSTFTVGASVSSECWIVYMRHLLTNHHHNLRDKRMI